jgi:aryl-alcohol dehydrogenase-like predicted oxidoreductase
MRKVAFASEQIGAIGFGAWGLSGDYGAADDSESIRTIHRALELGITHIDTADSYGDGHNERLVGKAIATRRDELVLATKIGMIHGSDGTRSVCGRPDYVHRAAEASLERLGIERVDLLYLHRVDPDVPVEESVGAMAELVAAGKVRYVGLSEVSPATIRRAHAVHPIAAVQSEYSLWTREPEVAVLPCLDELGIRFVAFSPLGRGYLTTQLGNLSEGDFRRLSPRFTGENMKRNEPLLRALSDLAAARGLSPAQLALAWLLHRRVVPIPGTRRAERVEENAAAADVHLTESEVEALEQAFPMGVAAGARYSKALEALVDQPEESPHVS